MTFKILQTVPICPKCQAMMLNRAQGGDIYFYCTDCMNPLKVIGPGKAENELIVTDGRDKEYFDDTALRMMKDSISVLRMKGETE